MTNGTIAGFRLSAQQERIWAQQAGGGHTPFVVAGLVRVDGKVVPEKLQAALNQVIARHEILRTVFHRQSGMKVPFQVIREKLDCSWETIDLTALSTAAQVEELEQQFQSARMGQFDFEQGPIVRVCLVKLADANHALLLSAPAVSADVSSLRNLLAEMGQIYAGHNISSDAMQYADVVEWQNELLQAEDTRAGREFWRDHCRKLDLGALDSILLPLEGKADAAVFSPDRVSLSLDAPFVSRMEATAARQNASAADFLSTCWVGLISRYTGLADVVVGYGFDGRKYEELKDALGLFARYLPLQAHLEPTTPFDALLEGVKASVAEAKQWEESFAWSQVEGATDAAGPALPFGFEFSEAWSANRYGEVRFGLEREYACLDRFKLKLSAHRSEPGLSLEFHYDAARLDRASVERLTSSFETLLAAAVANPQTLVSRLPLLGAAERQRIVVDWNQTSAEFPAVCLHQLFEQQAARTPDRAAVRCGDSVLSYQELNQQANQLAHHLRSLGVGPDSLVGLCLERSSAMMVALLAILKAGGAYVPLNPDTPKPRLKQQLAGAKALITEQALLAQMPEFDGRTLCIDRDQKQWASESVANLDLKLSPESLVYVIYTSGSTGIPKGVGVRHRNLVNYSTFITRRLELEKFPEGLQFATVSTLGADLGNTSIFPSLISGGCLHVIPYDVSTDAQRLARYNIQHPVDVLKIVPSHLQALLHSSDGAQVLPRKYLITGGETLTPQLIEKIQSLSPSCQLMNHYGPTETTVGSLTLKLQDYDAKKQASASLPIGRPISNTQVYILDAQLEPVPVGVVGELYIGGAGVSSGYLNQPDKTAERFVKNPFVVDPNARMYRTGDLARYLPDGNVEFLGRGDDQVKIRGFRIELGEIEAVLAQHASVKQVVVLAREDERGDKRLVAYVVGQRDANLSADTLKAHVKEQLPDYMVPSAIVLLAKLPLTPNGKIDRQALPAPEQAQTKAYVAPSTPTEQAVASIWSEVLRRERISAEDNFFDMGGHSLMATQIVSRIREHFRIDLPMRILFEKPTIRELAEAVQNTQASSSEDAAPIVRVSREAYRAGRS